ncbi:MAG TPA: 16S rRNA methyltransferase [Thermoplasmata archaeon]|nr:16S rRNA methyltransferase [Thermoplasmata archaeon]
MLTLILADAELETVPSPLQGHPAVRTSAKRRGRSPAAILLDSSLHHPALKNFPEGERRGRPDIVHLFALLCLDSVLNAQGQLRTIVHTRNDDVIRLAPETRIPKNYPRFVGLVEDLFQKGAVPEGKPLLALERGVPLGKLLSEARAPAWAFKEGGERVNLWTEFANLEGDLVAVVGGFPHGDFRSPVAELCDRVVSIHEEPLRAWTVTSEILVAYRQRLLPPKDGSG